MYELQPAQVIGRKFRIVHFFGITTRMEEFSPIFTEGYTPQRYRQPSTINHQHTFSIALFKDCMTCYN
ncbi:hypothetical protein NQU17_05375 [Clostridiaceae bacterium HFYG-1003]|nr:hypothetical protein NQU17_05375 [Clostridiaceae bacterium HFYG-1003]